MSMTLNMNMTTPRFAILLLCMVWTCIAASAEDATPKTAACVSGDAVIRSKAGNSEIVITTTSRLAGAIHSLTWNGIEFIDSVDHGRQLQSASNFDNNSRYTDETFNPTEAGSRADHIGPTSTSHLLKLHAKDNTLETISQMAFWLKPGEKSLGNLAKNTTALSNHLLTKRVVIGYKDLPHVIDYQVTFTIPANEKHTYAQFEALTGYMPPTFSRFHKFDPMTGELSPISDGPGEQAMPIVLATESGGHAMGIFSPDQPSKGYETVGYGRWRFKPEQVNKWNTVFRYRDPKGVKAGEYRFRMFVMVGSLADVKASMAALVKEFAPAK